MGTQEYAESWLSVYSTKLIERTADILETHLHNGLQARRQVCRQTPDLNIFAGLLCLGYQNGAFRRAKNILVASAREKTVLPLRKLDRNRLKARLEFLNGGLDTFNHSPDGFPIAVDHDFPVLLHEGEMDFVTMRSSIKLGFACENKGYKLLRNIPNALCGLGRLG